MTNATGPRRGRVLTGTPIVQYEPLSAKKWAELEAAFGKPFPSLLRRNLEIVSTVYVTFASRFANTKVRSDVKRSLSKWRKETVSLRHYVWSDPVEPQNEKGGTLAYPLAEFARILDNAIAAVDGVFDILNDLPSNQSNQAFEIWLVLVRKYFEEQGLKTSAASGDKMVSNSPFIRFLEKYQQCLQIQSVLYGPSSLSKYVQKATQQYGKLKFPILILKLTYLALALQSKRVSNATTFAEAVPPQILRQMRAERAGKKYAHKRKKNSR